MKVTEFHQVKFEDIADFFDVPKQDIQELLGKFGTIMPTRISKGILYKILVAGAQLEGNVIDDLDNKFSVARSKMRKQVGESQRIRIITRDKNRCRYCSKKLNKNSRVIDHFIPWSKGGRNSDDNLVLSCRVCNSKKGDSFIENTNLVLLPIPD